MPNILLVAQDSVLQQSVSAVLETRLGYQVLFAETAITPLAAQSNIVLYEMLPELVPSGNTLALRRLSQHLPVVLLVKNPETVTVPLMLQAGALDFVHFPVTVERLHITLKNALSLHGMRRNLTRHPPRETYRVEKTVPTLALLDGEGHFKDFHTLEEEIIHQALDYHQGCLSRVARQLGIGRTTLYRKMREQNGTGSQVMHA